MTPLDVDFGFSSFARANASRLSHSTCSAAVELFSPHPSAPLPSNRPVVVSGKLSMVGNVVYGPSPLV